MPLDLLKHRGGFSYCECKLKEEMFCKVRYFFMKSPLFALNTSNWCQL